ncbi:hypothetical protein V5N11_009015 [Cardamine amara subsp. amara]|uniref:Uncharacterized protein n=1 Tax=Cardamine amara subsp. amara TaxID=228776 RepID=A0ABD1C7G8_CARAN
MAATSTWLKLTPLQWNPSFSYTQQRHHPTVHFCFKPKPRSSNVVRLQIDVKYKQSTRSDTYERSDTNHDQILKNSFDEILSQIKKTLDSLKKPVIATVLLSLLLLCNRNCALAASGGRIGGSAFSSRSRSSESSSSSSKTFSYSAPSTLDPTLSFSYSAISIWGNKAPCSFLLWAPRFIYIPLTLLFFALAVFLNLNDIRNDTQKTSVLKVQVGLLGSARTLQEDFNRLAEKADTSTPEGLSYVLTEATLALLRHPEFCISSYSSVDVKSSIEEGEKRFNQFSIEERGKFDEETLVNVNSIKIQSSKIQKASGSSNEYIVVTILVASEGTLKLQTINGIADLKETLQKLGSILSKKILAVEVMWTPQNEKDVLSERELLEDYPLLKPF